MWKIAAVTFHRCFRLRAVTYAIQPILSVTKSTRSSCQAYGKRFRCSLKEVQLKIHLLNFDIFVVSKLIPWIATSEERRLKCLIERALKVAGFSVGIAKTSQNSFGILKRAKRVAFSAEGIQDDRIKKETFFWNFWTVPFAVENYLFLFKFLFFNFNFQTKIEEAGRCLCECLKTRSCMGTWSGVWTGTVQATVIVLLHTQWLFGKLCVYNVYTACYTAVGYITVYYHPHVLQYMSHTICVIRIDRL